MSFITQLMRDNKNWNKILESKQIKIKEDEHFYIFNYDISANFFDPIVQEARGIIIDKKDLSIACWPFRKFGNFGEDYVDIIDWPTARVQSKEDGSICKLWFNKYDNDWQWSTNSVIDARESDSASLFSNNYYEIIQKADNLKDIKFNELNKNYTYIFELVGPENTIVVHYDNIHLYHIGTRNNKTGKETVHQTSFDFIEEKHEDDEIVKELKEINPLNLTPIEALNKLYELTEKVKK